MHLMIFEQVMVMTTLTLKKAKTGVMARVVTILCTVEMITTSTICLVVRVMTNSLVKSTMLSLVMREMTFFIAKVAPASTMVV